MKITSLKVELLSRAEREANAQTQRVADAAEMAVTVSHPTEFVEQLFVAAWRPEPNPGGVPSPAKTDPTDAVLIGEFRNQGLNPWTKAPASSNLDPLALGPDRWGQHVAVARPLAAVGYHRVTEVTQELEYFVALARNKDLFLLVRAESDCVPTRVSIPTETSKDEAINQANKLRIKYLIDTATQACREKHPDFTCGATEYVAAMPDEKFSLFLRSAKTSMVGTVAQGMRPLPTPGPSQSRDVSL